MNTSNNDDSLWLMIETIQTNAMRAMDISLQELPQHSAYKEAVLRAPLLVQRESNKLSFLRYVLQYMYNEKMGSGGTACTGDFSSHLRVFILDWRVVTFYPKQQV